MEDKTFLEQFDTIEKRVGQLLEICQALQAEKAELQNRVDRLERELQAKAEAENRHQTERETIRSRIDALLSRLDGLDGPPH